MTGTSDTFKMFSFSVMQSTFRFSNVEMSGTGYFGETALKQDITHLSTPCENHTIGSLSNGDDDAEDNEDDDK